MHVIGALLTKFAVGCLTCENDQIGLFARPYDPVGNLGAAARCFTRHCLPLLLARRARAAARNKPVLVVKVGRFTETVHAAASHTRALTGADAVYEAAFEGGRARPWYYEMQEIGWNYRMPDILCALGISQLRKLRGFHAQRAELARAYDAQLAHLAPMVRPVGRRDVPHGWHLYAVQIDFAQLGLSRAKLIHSQRGPHGGSVLAREASRITVYDVVQAVDPIQRITSCPLGIRTHGVNLCPLHRRLDGAIALVERAFKDSPIAELIVARGGGSRALCDEPATGKRPKRATSLPVV